MAIYLGPRLLVKNHYTDGHLVDINEKETDCLQNDGGHRCLDQMSIGQMYVGRMPFSQMPFGQIFVIQMPVGWISVGLM